MEAPKFPKFKIVARDPSNSFELVSVETLTRKENEQVREVICENCKYNSSDITPRTKEKTGGCNGVIGIDGCTRASIHIPLVGEVDVTLMESASCGLASALIEVAKTSTPRYFKRRFVAMRPVVLK
jgi:hypothetical protein